MITAATPVRWKLVVGDETVEQAMEVDCLGVTLTSYDSPEKEINNLPSHTSKQGVRTHV